MARLVDGVADHLDATYPFSSFSPPCLAVTISAWLWRDNTTANTMILEQGNDASNGFDVVQNVFVGNQDLVRSFFNGIQSWADSYTAPATGEWHHHMWVIWFGGAGLNKVYIDGSPAALTDQGHTSFAGAYSTGDLSLGARDTAGVYSLFWAGRFAELGVWTDEVPATGALALSSGVPPPFVFDDALVGYMPLAGDPSPEPNYTEGQERFTLTGTSYTKHPGTRMQLMGKN